MAVTLPPKSPAETVRYAWKPKTSGYLATVTVSPVGVTVTRSGVTDEEAFFYLSGGTLDDTATVIVTATTTDGETLAETFYVPVRATAAALGVLVSDVLSYALRPIVGMGEVATADEQADARENLDIMLASWAESGADLGIKLPTAEGDLLRVPDGYVSAIKAGLRVRLCELYGKPVTATDLNAARRGEILVKFNSLPDARAGVFY